jgi:hypothetical protein
MSAFRPASGPWGALEVLEDGGPGGFSPAVALSPGGSGAAAWQGPPGVLGPIQVTVRPREAASWPASTPLLPGDGGHLRVALGDGGDAVVGWISGAESTGFVEVHGVRRSPDGSWSRPAVLYSRDVRDSRVGVLLRDVGVGRDGTAVVLAEVLGDPPATTIAAVSRRGGDGWEIETLAEVRSSVAAFGDDGGAIVAWGFSTLPMTVRSLPPSPSAGG